MAVSAGVTRLATDCGVPYPVGMPIFRKRRWLHLPITINVTLMVLNIALMVCWIVLLARFRTWSMLTIGTIIFALSLVGLAFYLVISIRTWRLQLQQQNFVDSVTHELKTPIASLRLYLETLQMREMSAEQRGNFYSTMERELKRLDHLISQLLEVGRLDAIDQHSEPEDIALEPLLRNCASAASAHQNCEPESIHFDIQPAVIHGRRIVLEMIFGNLIDNALKYAGSPPRVEVEVRTKSDGRIVTRIADNGAGVPPHLRKKIFNLFYRGGNELERRQQGTGLGLYIVRTLVHLLKGTVAVHDRPGKPGSVFEVDLPGRGSG